jgi:histidyl-tRNA synthetase
MTDSYKGVRDFYPEDQRVQTHLFSSMRRVAESFGYEEYNASILEPTELYSAKSSEEIIRDQTYTFEDRGGRSVTLRPEMTPTVARMVAARKRELGYPLRLYSIPNLFRYERTQRGRLREHWQLNVDLFGVPGPEADAEIIVLAHRLFTELGADESMFKVRINDRRMLSEGLQGALRDPAKVAEATALIDRKEKMDFAQFEEEWNALAAVSFGACFPVSDEVTALLVELKARGVGNAVYDPTIVRGFTYYTGTVFEIFDTHVDNNRSMMGGGRYDTLVEKYGSEPLPACGFGLGDVTLRLFLETHNLLPTLLPAAKLYLIPLTDGAARIADGLRNSGVNVALGMKHEKVADHIRNAEKLGIPYIAVYGESEAVSNELAIKHLGTGTETKLAIDKVYAFLLQS